MRVCALVCWNPTFQLFELFALLAAAAAAAAVRIMFESHTVPQALKLSTLWQPRYNSSRTASLCRPLLNMRVLTYHMRVCCVCYVCYVRVCRFV